MSHAKGSPYSSHKLQDHAHEQRNLSRLKEDNPSPRRYHPRLSHTEHECRESLIQRKIQI